MRRLPIGPLIVGCLGRMVCLLPLLAPSLSVADVTVRVSVSSTGAEANGDSAEPCVSPDARYIAFSSDATNLVPGDTNGVRDVFVHDRATGQTVRASVDSLGNQGNGYSGRPSISADGRYIAFQSSATNLVAGDTNGADDIFVWDRVWAETTRVSVDSAGSQANAESTWPRINADGRYVAFESNATNLVAGDTNGVRDVFRHDRSSGETVRASVDGAVQGNGGSITPAISANGAVVVFASVATNLSSIDTNGVQDIFVHDFHDEGYTWRWNENYYGSPQQANGWSGIPAISADGRCAAWETDATNFPGNSNGRRDIAGMWSNNDACLLVSRADDGEGNEDSLRPSVSADGTYIAFDSAASNLVGGDANGYRDVFVSYWWMYDVSRVSVSSSGAEGNSWSDSPSISGSSRFVAFRSAASNLVAADTNGKTDIVLWMRNGAPGKPSSASISPGAPISTDDLVGTASGGSDPDGDPVTYTYQWTRSADGGQSWTPWGSGPTVPASATTRGELWKVRARATDGWAESGLTESAAVTIGDAPPPAPTTVTVAPASPSTLDDLAASADGSTDPDGDAVSYEYEWCCSGDGETWDAWGRAGATLPNAETTKGEHWKARAKAVAGGRGSDWTESSPTAIGNAAPVLAWAGTAGYEGDGHQPDKGRPNRATFSWRVLVTDADGTAATEAQVEVEGLVDGRQWKSVADLPLTPISGDWASGMTCEATSTLGNGVHRYRFVVSDGEAPGTGPPSDWTVGPQIVAPPQLWCTDLRGRKDDYVHPNQGRANDTRFRFAVQYTDGEGTPPTTNLIVIEKHRKDGTWAPVASAPMVAASGTPTTGQYYTYGLRLPAGKYRHRFQFADDDGQAQGSEAALPDPTQWLTGPSVTVGTAAQQAAAVDGALLTSLVATPTRAGAQFTFMLARPAIVGARVLTVAGRPLRTLCLAEPREAGAGLLMWNHTRDDGLRVPSGVYLVEIMARGEGGGQARRLTTCTVTR
jgi:Tol biopolymer transport system component